jgi:hypothetical protein
MAWCNNGEVVKTFEQQINDSKTLEELGKIWVSIPAGAEKDSLFNLKEKRKSETIEAQVLPNN